MLTSKRAFRLNSKSAPLLPQPTELQPLWDWGVAPRQGQLIMIAGRSGSQKTGFVLFWLEQMGVPALYFSGDSTPFEMTTRIVEMNTLQTLDQIEANLNDEDQSQRYTEALERSCITFSFGAPITWASIEANIEAWVELHNAYPPIIVVDNLMDMEGAESDYHAQKAAMQDLTALSRLTGATVIVLHHATDKSQNAATQPGLPPSRREIVNGGAEKPQLILTVALSPEFNEFRVAVPKQRSGKSDPEALDYIRLRAYPEFTRFAPLNSPIQLEAKQ